jgi:protein-S-isoprenylcysteine O-methyltransferase Ste14
MIEPVLWWLKIAAALTAGAGIVGGVIGMILGWGFLTGAYILTLAASVVVMLIAIYYMIGSPGKRFDFFTQRRYRETGAKDSLSDAVAPILIAVWLMVFGFFLESLLH